MAFTSYQQSVANTLNQINTRDVQLRAMQQAYQGLGSYGNKAYATFFKDDKKEYIRVDKGSPDKANYVIFYVEAVPRAEPKDPMIFVDTKKELGKEVDKLAKRTDVDTTSIRIFSLAAVAKIELEFVINKDEPSPKKVRK